MQRLKITIAYDGTNYAGWQVQPNGVTIQEKIEAAIRRVAGEEVKVHGSGRTDQGVHARGQVAHFDVQNRPRDLKGLQRSMNAVLPPDIRILRVSLAAPDFHSRRSAVWKEYRYFIWDKPVMPPFERSYRLHVGRRLDIGEMNKAAGLLAGRHDFAAFTANPNREVESTVRTLKKLKAARSGGNVVITAVGDGFLYKMVRSIAGYLIRVGEGMIPWQETGEILKSLERTARVPTAQPQGLFLWKVTF